MEGGGWVGKAERDSMGKREMEGRGGGILWEGSQSNYRQRCSPGFFGGTKFTFQRSLPPSPSTLPLLLLSLLLPATLFLMFSHHGLHHLTVHPHTPHPALSPPACLSWLHEKGKAIELYHQQSMKTCHPIAVSCLDLKDACSILPRLQATHNSVRAYQPFAEELQHGLMVTLSFCPPCDT